MLTSHCIRDPNKRSMKTLDLNPDILQANQVGTIKGIDNGCTSEFLFLSQFTRHNLNDLLRNFNLYSGSMSAKEVFHAVFTGCTDKST